MSHVFCVVGAVLKKARKWKIVDRNPMEDVDRPKRDKAKARPRVLDSAGLKSLLDRAATTRLYPLLVLAAATGCRRGELLALEWSDLNLNTGVLSVSKSLEETRGGLRVKPTKSNKPRAFPVPASALAVLKCP
jgi:integrase